MTLPEDERAQYRAAHHQRRRRLPTWLVGLLLLLVCTIGPYLAFTKHIPGTGYGYELDAVFANSVSISKGSPVRVAGVNVGKVIESERDGNQTRVRFNVGDEALPINNDANVKIRPRMFFEGNWFLDLDQGSPSARELDSGDTIPVTQTATAVQFDEILTSLQEPSRDALGDVLIEYGTALNRRPTRPSENRSFDPIVQGKTGAEALNLAFKYGGPAGKSSAQVLESFQGTEPNDLSRLISASAETFDALSVREEALRELITNWNVFTGALASESSNLSRTFAELAPTLEASETSLANLNETLPPLRTFARELEPSLRELPATIDAAYPWLEQADQLLGEDEAGRSIALIKRSLPGLTKAADRGLDTLSEIGLLSRCASEVLVPTGDQVIDDQFSIGEPNYREFFYSTVNLVGESSGFDGNGTFINVAPAVGDVLMSAIDPTGTDTGLRPDRILYTHATLPVEGTQPQLGGLPPLKPRVACHSNDIPDLNAGLGQPGPPSPEVTPPPFP